jgi:uncharacterized protein YbjQ (UPF0145 family)
MFTSTLTVNEFALGGLIGAQPITQVMGSSFQQVGYTGWYGSGWTGGGALVEEMRPMSQAYNDARARALERMDDEARRAGADAVVAVRIHRSRRDWSGDAIEFTAIGTAVRMPGSDPHAAPRLSNLSGADHYLLVQAGWRPLGLVAATCVCYVQASWTTQRLTTGWRQWRNAELRDFTQGVYEARELALGRLTSQAEGLRAAGVVGVTVEQEQHVRDVDRGGGSRKDLIVTFHVTGTAIAEGGGGVAPQPVMRRNEREL